MKKCVYALVLMLLCIGVVGCGSDDSLSQEQNDLIAEYAANRVLQSNPDYENRLYDTESEVSGEASADAEATTEATTQESTDAADNEEDGADSTTQTAEEEPIAADLSSQYASHSIEVVYDSYSVADSYNDNNDLSAEIDADTGNKLLIVTFKVKNTSDKTNEVDLLDANYQYQLHTSSGSYDPLLTIIDNDLSTYQEKLKPKGSKKAVLLFEISNSEAEAKGFTLDVSNGTAQSQVDVQ